VIDRQYTVIVIDRQYTVIVINRQYSYRKYTVIGSIDNTQL